MLAQAFGKSDSLAHQRPNTGDLRLLPRIGQALHPRTDGFFESLESGIQALVAGNMLQFVHGLG